MNFIQIHSIELLLQYIGVPASSQNHRVKMVNQVSLFMVLTKNIYETIHIKYKYQNEEYIELK